MPDPRFVALMRYGRHRSTCEASPIGGQKGEPPDQCDCGFSDALAASSGEPDEALEAVEQLRVSLQSMAADNWIELLDRAACLKVAAGLVPLVYRIESALLAASSRGEPVAWGVVDVTGDLRMFDIRDNTALAFTTREEAERWRGEFDRVEPLSRAPRKPVEPGGEPTADEYNRDLFDENLTEETVAPSEPVEPVLCEWCELPLIEGKPCPGKADHYCAAKEGTVLDLLREPGQRIAAGEYANDPSHTHDDYPKMRCRQCRDQEALAEEITDVLRDTVRGIMREARSWADGQDRVAFLKLGDDCPASAESHEFSAMVSRRIAAVIGLRFGLKVEA